MPELPEVQTTVDGINSTVRGRTITAVWTDYKSAHLMHADSIKSPAFFATFRKNIKGKKILKAERRAKNILIHLTGDITILIHMKMTGHLMYGEYKKTTNTKHQITKWTAVSDGPLTDPYNQFLHLVFTLDNGKHLAFSDVRKFAKVTFIKTSELESSSHLSNLGPEPLSPHFSYQVFKERILKRPNGKIKQVLMDQSLISGIGNIYSDEILWRSNVHPISTVSKIPDKHLKLMYRAVKETLEKGIKFGGDSTSDYRNIKGERGAFQGRHSAYQRTGERCAKPRCKGIIERMMVGGRSAHFCPVHQELFR
jgi:formamidopyrimidine-DNA glycosylase